MYDNNPAEIAILGTISETTKDSSLQTEAEWAISSLRRGNKPHDNLKDLRAEVLGLQKSNREMKKEREELKRKVKAIKPSSSAKEASDASKNVKAERLNASKRTTKK